MATPTLPPLGTTPPASGLPQVVEVKTSPPQTPSKPQLQVVSGAVTTTPPTPVVTVTAKTQLKCTYVGPKTKRVCDKPQAIGELYEGQPRCREHKAKKGYVEGVTSEAPAVAVTPTFKDPSEFFAQAGMTAPVARAALPLPQETVVSHQVAVQVAPRKQVEKGSPQVEDDNQIPADAQVINLPQLEASAATPPVRTVESPQDPLRWEHEVSDLYTLQPWLKDICPLSEMRDPQEHALKLKRLIKYNTTDGMMWKGVRYALPPILEGIGNYTPFKLDGIGNVIGLMEQEFKSLLLTLRMENEELIDQYLSTTAKLAGCLGIAVMTTHSINMKKLALQGPPPGAPYTPATTQAAVAPPPQPIEAAAIAAATASTPVPNVTGTGAVSIAAAMAATATGQAITAPAKRPAQGKITVQPTFLPGVTINIDDGLTNTDPVPAKK